MSKKKIMIVIAAVSTVIVVMALAFVFFVFSAVGKLQKADYYKMGEDNIPSIRLVVGERKLKGTSSSIENGIIKKLYEYQSETASDDISQYKQYLSEKEGYLVVKLENQDNILTYGKESIDEGEIILINIDSTPFGYTINLIKGKGEIDLYD